MPIIAPFTTRKSSRSYRTDHLDAPIGKPFWNRIIAKYNTIIKNYKMFSISWLFSSNVLEIIQSHLKISKQCIIRYYKNVSTADTN